MQHCTYKAAAAQAAAIEKDWGRLSWLAGNTVGNADGLTLGRVLIRAGHSNPSHAHMNCEEALYLLAGRLEHHTGEATGVLAAGDTLIVPAGVFHNATSIGEQDADMIVAYSSADRDFIKQEETQ